MKTYNGKIYSLEDNQIFVFGSNTEGRHGAGAAKVALNKFGAIYGQSSGRQGNSYAIITKNLKKSVHPSIDRFDIIYQIIRLYQFATENSNLEFLIAYSNDVEVLRSGYTPSEMADLFWVACNDIPDNIVFETSFDKLVRRVRS